MFPKNVFRMFNLNILKSFISPFLLDYKSVPLSVTEEAEKKCQILEVGRYSLKNSTTCYFCRCSICLIRKIMHLPLFSLSIEFIRKNLLIIIFNRQKMNALLLAISENVLLLVLDKEFCGPFL